MNLATAIFVLTYVLVSLGENSPRKLDRPTATLLGAVLMIVTGSLSRSEAAGAIDLRTLALLFGMMVLLAVLMQSGLPAWLALTALRRCRNPQVLLAVVVFSAGIGSAVMLNDTVCLLATPLLLQVATHGGLAAGPFLLALATSANVGSVMTLTGNPQNMIIGHASGWTWPTFALRMVPIGLLCLVANWLLLAALYRSDLRVRETAWRAPTTPNLPLDSGLAAKSVLAFAALIIAFLAGMPMDLAAMVAATLLLVWINRPPGQALERVDWSLLLFFAGLFVVVAGFVKADLALLDRLVRTVRTDLGLLSVLQVSLVALVGSNLFSNVPFVLIVGHWVRQMPQPHFVWLLLALTSTFAGNLTLFGSVANLIVAQGCQKTAPLRFTDFLRVGVPITLVTTALGAFLLWAFLRWGWI